jgi:hypothetical protein
MREATNRSIGLIFVQEIIEKSEDELLQRRSSKCKLPNVRIYIIFL